MVYGIYISFILTLKRLAGLYQTRFLRVYACAYPSNNQNNLIEIVFENFLDGLFDGVVFSMLLNYDFCYELCCFFAEYLFYELGVFFV